jgi:hypothetical protein
MEQIASHKREEHITDRGIRKSKNFDEGGLGEFI